MEIGKLYKGMFSYGGKRKKGKFMFIGEKVDEDRITILVMSNHKLMEPFFFEPTTWHSFADNSYFLTYMRGKGTAKLYNITGGN